MMTEFVFLVKWSLLCRVLKCDCFFCVSQVFTRYGKCYTFNSGESGTPKISVKGGMGNGLEIMLDIQQDEYLPVWGETSENAHPRRTSATLLECLLTLSFSSRWLVVRGGNQSSDPQSRWAPVYRSAWLRSGTRIPDVRVVSGAASECWANVMFFGACVLFEHVLFWFSWCIFLLRGGAASPPRRARITSKRTASAPAARTARRATWWKTATVAWCTCRVSHSTS